jgi:hypothetical protein
MTCEVPASATGPALIVSLTSLQFKSSGRSRQLEPGRTKWIAAGQKESVKNPGAGHAEFLRFDFKSKPLKAGVNDKEWPHVHPHE